MIIPDTLFFFNLFKNSQQFCFLAIDFLYLDLTILEILRDVWINKSKKRKSAHEFWRKILLDYSIAFSTCYHEPVSNCLFIVVIKY
jgi:hypothetical protein